MNLVPLFLLVQLDSDVDAGRVSSDARNAGNASLCRTRRFAKASVLRAGPTTDLLVVQSRHLRITPASATNRSYPLPTCGILRKLRLLALGPSTSSPSFVPRAVRRGRRGGRRRDSERRAASVTAAACKASAGAVEYLPVARVRNLADWLGGAKERGSLGLPRLGRRRAPLHRGRLVGAGRLVLGSEGSGLRRRVSETCDELVSIPVAGRVGSLNASCRGRDPLRGPAAAALNWLRGAPSDQAATDSGAPACSASEISWSTMSR
jgi:SpoU rRNA Methylase family